MRSTRASSAAKRFANASPLRHGSVHEQEIIRIAPVARCSEGGQHLLPAARQHRAQAGALQHFAQIASEGGVARRDEHARPSDERGYDLALRGHPGQRKREAEGAPCGGGAIDLDATVHQIDKLARNGQPESGAAILARDRRVGLRESSKDRIELVRGDSAPGVTHAEANQVGFGAAFDALDAHGDLSALGEFHRVADQVREHLAQPCGVAAQHPGNIGPDVVKKLDPLLRCPQRQAATGFAHDRRGRKIDRLDLQPPRLDAREVEDVIDDREQRIGRGFHCEQILPLLARDARIEHEIGHPDDAVHRRADFVAHVGEEIAFGTARGLGRLLGLEQLELAQLALGDVTPGPFQPPPAPALALAHRAPAQLDPAPAAVLRPATQLDGQRGVAPQAGAQRIVELRPAGLLEHL